MTRPKPPVIPYDSGYKLLFSHSRLVADLLTGFIKPAWLHLIDLSMLEPCKASFATDDLRQRHDDCIWRVKMRDIDTWLYLYILIEFQSRNEHFMAIRILSYEALLCQDLIRTLKLKPGDRLLSMLNRNVRFGGADKILDYLGGSSCTRTKIG